VTRSGVAMLGTRAARVVRLGEVARHQPDSFAGRLPVRCLISGRLLHGELSRRVCLQAFVGDGSTAADRGIVASVFDPLEGPIERREPVPQAGSYRVVAVVLVAAPDTSRRVRPHDHLSGPCRDRPAAAAPAYAPCLVAIEPAPVHRAAAPLLLLLLPAERIKQAG
jgi:hypothetical protein